MSFDIFVQKFDAGGAGTADAAVVRAILAPYFNGNDTRVLHLSDGTADLYGWEKLSRGFMINHAGGAEIYDVLVRVAREARLAILPVGCGTVVTSPDEIAHLPSELREDVAVVTNGRELLAVIRRR